MSIVIRLISLSMSFGFSDHLPQELMLLLLLFLRTKMVDGDYILRARALCSAPRLITFACVFLEKVPMEEEITRVNGQGSGFLTVVVSLISLLGERYGYR